MQSSESESFERWVRSARVLLVDDEPANLTFLRHVLETEGYAELIAFTDPVEACDRFAEIDPDVVVIDLWMPRLDGFEVIARIQEQLPAGNYLPILVVTGDPTPEARRRALSTGARDFLTKPLSPSEVRLRVGNLLETRFLHMQLKQHNALLEQRVDQRTFELEAARLEILYRLARAAEFRDYQTGQHTLRVARLAGRMAQVLGMPMDQAELITRAAPLHDLGKIGIPDAVLLKPARLNRHERSVIEAHTVIGAEILSGSAYPLLQLAEEIALNHHERWDGLGYPHQLLADATPVSGRIVAVADVFDALTHARPYKSAWTARDALAEIEANAGTQFDPAVVDALLRVAPEAAVIAADVDASSRRRLAAPTLCGTAPVAENAARKAIQQLREERDAMAREVQQLRQQLLRREPRRTARTARRRAG
jgi:putative two-component system response regulator